MALQPIDLDSWPRKEHYFHYMDDARCGFSLVVEVDITHLRQALAARGLKAYPAQIYMLARAVNHVPQMRMGLGSDGRPGIWDECHPGYTVFNPASQTFSCLWAQYTPDFSAFYAGCLADMAAHGGTTAFYPKGPAPQNSFDISCLPWLDFSACNINLFTSGTHLAPIFTIGRYRHRDGRTLMPLAIQVHHAACDGFHVHQLVSQLEGLAGQPEAWLA